jgi:O-antigen/teichoic acid export membrane protein
LGLNDIVTRDFVRYPDKVNIIFGTSVYLRFFSSFFLISVIIGILFFSDLSTEIKTLIYLLSATIVLQSFDIFDRLFQSKIKAKTSVKAYLISLTISSILKIIFVLVQAPVIAFATVQVIELAILVSGWFYGYFKEFGNKLELHFSKPIAIMLLKESVVVVFSSLMIILYMRIDQVMIQQMLNETELGNFTAAVKLSESYYFIPTVLTASLFPAIINGKGMGEKEYHSRLQRLYDFLTWTAIPFALVISFVAVPIASIYGPKFQHVAPVLSIHIWAGVFVFWGVAATKYFIIEQMPYFITFSTFIGCVLNIGLNLYFIPHFGIIGAAVSTITAQFFATFMGLLFFRKSRVIFFITLRSLNIFRVIASLRHHKA